MSGAVNFTSKQGLDSLARVALRSALRDVSDVVVFVLGMSEKHVVTTLIVRYNRIVN